MTIHHLSRYFYLAYLLSTPIKHMHATYALSWQSLHCALQYALPDKYELQFKLSQLLTYVRLFFKLSGISE